MIIGRIGKGGLGGGVLVLERDRVCGEGGEAWCWGACSHCMACRISGGVGAWLGAKVAMGAEPLERKVMDSALAAAVRVTARLCWLARAKA